VLVLLILRAPFGTPVPVPMTIMDSRFPFKFKPSVPSRIRNRIAMTEQALSLLIAAIIPQRCQLV
jgi:hypothetical protein